MKLFQCGHCRHLLFFESTTCLGCGRESGFVPSDRELYPLQRYGDASFLLVGGDDRRFRPCGNRGVVGCNWLFPEDEPATFCRACLYTRTTPNLGLPVNRELWTRLETAKRRLLYSLLRLGRLPATKIEQPETGLAFDFKLPQPPAQAGAPSEPVVTGHANGLVTMNAEEADPSKRESTREKMSERYRTLLGHFRHEVGHYFWDRLIGDAGRHGPFRRLFGDEQMDYAAALEAHYARGAPPDWSDRFISPYASAHPWEDWAECFAHTLHVVDTLETAWSYGLRLEAPGLDSAVGANPYEFTDFRSLHDQWVPVSLALNSLNRSMGQPDAYPFATPAPVLEKLEFLHACLKTPGPVRSGRSR